jgi:hypothetical protein
MDGTMCGNGAVASENPIHDSRSGANQNKRSTYAFCHGDPGEIGRSRMPMALTRDVLPQ